MAESFHETLLRVANEKHQVEIAGESKTVRMLELIIRRLSVNAAKGHKRSLNTILDVMGDKLISEAAMVAENEQQAKALVLEMSALVDKILAREEAEKKALEAERRAKGGSGNDKS